MDSFTQGPFKGIFEIASCLRFPVSIHSHSRIVQKKETHPKLLKFSIFYAKTVNGLLKHSSISNGDVISTEKSLIVFQLHL